MLVFQTKVPLLYVDMENAKIQLLAQHQPPNDDDSDEAKNQLKEDISINDISSFRHINTLVQILLLWHDEKHKLRRRTIVESLIAITLTIVVNTEYTYAILNNNKGSFVSQQHFWSVIIATGTILFFIARCIQQYIFATKFPYPWMIKDIHQTENLTANDIKFVKRALFCTKLYFLMALLSCMGTLVLDIEVLTSLFQSKSWIFIFVSVFAFIVQIWSSLLPSMIAFVAMIVIVVKYTVKLKQMINLVNQIKTNIVGKHVQPQLERNGNMSIAHAKSDDRQKQNDQQFELCDYSLWDISRMFSVIESDWKRDWDSKKNHWQYYLLFYAIGCILDLWMIAGILLSGFSYNYNNDDDEGSESEQKWIKSEPFHYFYTIYFSFVLMLFILPFALLLYFGGYMTYTYEKFQNELADLLISSDGCDLNANRTEKHNSNSIELSNTTSSNNYYRLHLKIQRTSVYFTVFGVKISFFVAIQSIAAFIVAKLLVFAYDEVN